MPKLQANYLGVEEQYSLLRVELLSADAAEAEWECTFAVVAGLTGVRHFVHVLVEVHEEKEAVVVEVLGRVSVVRELVPAAEALGEVLREEGHVALRKLFPHVVGLRDGCLDGFVWDHRMAKRVVVGSQKSRLCLVLELGQAVHVVPELEAFALAGDVSHDVLAGGHRATLFQLLFDSLLLAGPLLDCGRIMGSKSSGRF